LNSPEYRFRRTFPINLSSLRLVYSLSPGLKNRVHLFMLMATLFGLYPFLLKLYADAGYQGAKSPQGLAQVCRSVNVEIVRRCDVGKFVVLPSAGSWNAPSPG